MLKGVIDQLLLTWRMLLDPRVSFLAKIIPIAAVIYVISPLDFIPDFLIGIGQLDDLGILFAGMRLFEAVVPGYISAEHREAIARRHKPMEVVDAPKYKVIRSDEQ